MKETLQNNIMFILIIKSFLKNRGDCKKICKIVFNSTDVEVYSRNIIINKNYGIVYNGIICKFIPTFKNDYITKEELFEKLKAKLNTEDLFIQKMIFKYYV